jgi:hypothetical protein
MELRHGSFGYTRLSIRPQVSPPKGEAFSGMFARALDSITLGTVLKIAGGPRN